MDCHHATRLNDPAFLERFSEKIARRRVPLAGSMNLTHRCNLKCVHCYLRGPAAHSSAALELSTDEWHRIIDEVTEAGCLFMLISGGEPLLRPDFVDIYTHCKQNGLLVTVFTNATRIDQRVIDAFRRLPPQGVEVSIYGAGPDTYGKITGDAGAFDRCIDGIERLMTAGIAVSLKTILMADNRDDVDRLRSLAKGYGLDFRMDAAIFPRLNGGKEPTMHRIDPESAVDIEFSDPDLLPQWVRHYQQMKDIPMADALYNCGTGLTSFHIDPFGRLQPCLLADQPSFDLTKGAFSEGWQTVIPEIRKRRAGEGYICNKCEKRVLCGLCPAFFRLETGHEERPSDYLCALGDHRLKAILEYQRQDARHDG